MVAPGAALGEHLLELLLETISCSPDEGFDLSFGGSRSGICALPHYVAVSARLCNCGINAVSSAISTRHSPNSPLLPVI